MEVLYELEYLYEFSVSAQITGAIILLIWCFSKVSKNALDMCFSTLCYVDRNEQGMCIIKKEILQGNVKIIFNNIWAFICIVLGYFTSIFSNNEGAKLCVIIVLTISLIYMGKVISYLASKIWFNKDHVIPPEELDNYNVLMPITDDEVEEIANREIN